MAAPTLNGQIFSVNLKDGNKLFLSVTDSTLKTVEIVRPGILLDSKATAVSGALEIPSSVKIKDTVIYKVTSIADRAFANATELSFVSIPSSIEKIGDKAFEGCAKLEGVVFPASQPALGTGVFEGDSLIKAVSFGSDWHTMDLGMFASSAIESLYIPAKVRKVSNLKTASSLKAIDVDANNPAFSSKDGMLYSKDGKTLYSCPCSKEGAIQVAPGTQKILDGAFRNCASVTSVYLPASVSEFSYCEFASCSSLKELYILALMPPVTAKFNGAKVFALQLVNKTAKVFVPAASLSLFQTALCCTAGEYESLSGATPKVSLVSDDLVGKKSLVKIKAAR